MEERPAEGKTPKHLTLMAREYPTIPTVCSEIINLQAICNLPKATEHFLSDIHGEHAAFLHVINNASGAIRDKIEKVFGNSLGAKERNAIAALIYYPEFKMDELRVQGENMEDFYRVTLHRLILICRATTSKYSRSKVRKALPKDFAYIIDELLHTHYVDQDKEMYYERIITSIISLGRAEDFIVELCSLIKRMAVDQLHIVGDIFDRGPHPDVILDRLIEHHNVDIQWGNHDVLWMGAAAGSPVCVATAIKTSLQYDALDMLENSYGINILPLALFANEYYGDVDCSAFTPRNMPSEHYVPKDRTLYARMHKAIFVVQCKLEGQLLARHPEYNMADRDMLSRIDYDDMSLEVDGVKHKLLDGEFPTVDPKNPNELTEAERMLIEHLTTAFENSDRLQKHVRFIYSSGSVYLCSNGNLLFHGCVPLNDDGSYMEFDMGDGPVSGRAFLDYAQKLARDGMFAPKGSKERERGRDFLWFLWCGRNSPIFGRMHITTFERALIADKTTHKEPKNAYYKYCDDEEFAIKLLNDFGLHEEYSTIVNGHIPVRAKAGEDPMKANGRRVVIDGGFCRAYQSQTGIAGYTMFFSSKRLRIVEYEPYSVIEPGLSDNDIFTRDVMVKTLPTRMLVGDTDTGRELKERIADLMELLDAYRTGIVKES
ncbi:MAG: fructose-1,6-bisphosphatase [Clostridia bacterium]|nr:fructose-1,6-bisphosphatase [Clostridia bacterium]